MSLPETCPFCGAERDCKGPGSWVGFTCLTSIHVGQDIRRTQSRKCEWLERDRLLDRLAALEAEAKQAKDDEAWALESAVTIHPAGTSESFAPTHWSVRYWDGVRTLEETAPTIHAAIRALRANVEGGAR